MNSDQPFLSIVAATRNDEHGGNQLYRARLFVSTLLRQIDQLKLNWELVLVEWNPPSDRAPLREALSCDDKPASCNVRIITVPHEIHTQYEHSDNLKLYQFIAKNVGIRRAHGRYVLATNIDILFAQELVDYLAREKLDDDVMLRAIRYDVLPEIDESWDIDRRLQFCHENRLRIYDLNAVYDLDGRGRKIVPLQQRGLARQLRHKYRRLKESFRKMLSPHPRLFTNACGDFVLLDAVYWHMVRGYPEFPSHGVYVDGLLCYAAHYSGAREHILDETQCIYHVEHLDSWTPLQRIQVEAKLRSKKIPELTPERYLKLVNQMHQAKAPTLFNDENWGLASENLPEQSM